MSGHSKWATIHRQKETTDQKRGAQFTKIANAVIVAVRSSGGVTDPELNFKLRLAIEKAKSVNMPKDNIQRAIDRASGKGEGAVMEEITYEGYGPGGVGYLVETATDNRQRTIQEIKNIFDKNGGTIASPGAVSFNFKKIGLITIEASEPVDETILKIIDLGAEDVEEEGEILEIYIAPEKLMELKEKLLQANFLPMSVEIIEKPVNFVPVSDPKTARQSFNLVEKLEALDDVQKVFTNFDIPDEIILESGKLEA